MYNVNVGRIVNTSVAVDTDWLPSDISKSDAKIAKNPRKHTLMMMLHTTDAVVNIQYQIDSQTVVMNLNGGSALTAGSIYIFDIILHEGATYNIQYTGVAGPQNVTAIISASSDLNT